MRVTIEHREESAGLSGATKHHYVDCSVEFSEEEKAIIKARDLYNQNFRTGLATPSASGNVYVANATLSLVGRLMVVIGVPVFGIIAPFKGGIFGPLAGFCFFAGAALWGYGAFAMHRQENRLEAVDQTVRLRDLVNKGRFTVYAPDPQRANDIEQELRAALMSAKKLITDSAELKPRQTFEL